MSQRKTFDEILSLTPTLGEQASFELIAEIHSSNEIYWRCYSTADDADVDRIAERFLTNHARLANVELPHIFTKAEEPLAVFYVSLTTDDTTIKGAMYANGALMRTIKGNDVEKYIFIEDDTAHKWNYPSEGFTLPE